MIRSLLFYCPLVFLVCPVHAQESVPLETLKLDLNRPKTWGTKSYGYEASHPGSREKNGEGRVVFETKVGTDSIILNDT